METHLSFVTKRRVLRNEILEFSSFFSTTVLLSRNSTSLASQVARGMTLMAVPKFASRYKLWARPAELSRVMNFGSLAVDFYVAQHSDDDFFDVDPSSKNFAFFLSSFTQSSAHTLGFKKLHFSQVLFHPSQSFLRNHASFLRVLKNNAPPKAIISYYF